MNAIVRHEREVKLLKRFSPNQYQNYWDNFYSSGEFQFLENPSEIGRFGVIAEIILTHFKNPKILDIGCGVGNLCRLLPENQIEYYEGIDISSTAIQKAMTNYPHFSFSCCRFEDYKSDVLKDIVVASEILYYLDCTNINDSLFKILNKKGVLIISLFKAPSSFNIGSFLIKNTEILKHIEVQSYTDELVWDIYCVMKKIAK